MTYSRFIEGTVKAQITVDRKVLSDIALRDPAAFKAVVERAKAALQA
jgi:large subunit ribosomal protein L20